VSRRKEPPPPGAANLLDLSTKALNFSRELVTFSTECRMVFEQRAGVALAFELSDSLLKLADSVGRTLNLCPLLVIAHLPFIWTRHDMGRRVGDALGGSGPLFSQGAHLSHMVQVGPLRAPATYLPIIEEALGLALRDTE